MKTRCAGQCNRRQSFWKSSSVYLRRLGVERLEDRRLLDAAPQSQAIELFETSPALFVENQGQWPDESHFGRGQSPIFLEGAIAGVTSFGMGADSGIFTDINDVTDSSWGEITSICGSPTTATSSPQQPTARRYSSSPSRPRS